MPKYFNLIPVFVIAATVLTAILYVNSSGKFKKNDPFSGTIEQAWEAGRTNAINRDFKAIWQMMSQKSKDQLAQQLSRLQEQVFAGGRQAAAANLVLDEFEIDPASISQLDARQYFIAMFEGLNRAQPAQAESQVAELRNATLERVEYSGANAVVFWKTSSGISKFDNWISELGSWRMIANVE